MKHPLLFLLLVLTTWLRPFGTRAQTPDSLSQKLTSIFANVDKSQVPTGYLYEAGVRFLEPRFYNGVLSDSNLTEMNVLRYLRAQMRSSKVSGTDTLPDLLAFNARVKAATVPDGAVPIAMQYLPYASISPNALQDNLLTVQNEQVYDVAGRSQSPYQTNLLFAAAPELQYSRSGNVSFLFKRNLYLTGNGAVPVGVYLDFDDGRGYQPVTWGQPIHTSYTTAGVKRIKVKALYSILAQPAQQSSTTGTGGTRIQAQPQPSTRAYESWFDFTVQTVAEPYRYGDNGGYTVRIWPGNSQPGAKVAVRYGRGHGQHVVKPFIVVEQYNIAGAAPHLVECNNANNDIVKFLRRINVDLVTQNASFDETLEAAGYDLIYIDFERNTEVTADDIYEDLRKDNGETAAVQAPLQQMRKRYQYRNGAAAKAAKAPASTGTV